MVGVPRVLHRSIEALEPRGGHSQRIHVRLADDNRAGAFQSLDDICIFGGDAIRESLERGSCLDARGVIEILHADGDAVQRPPPAAARYFRRGGARSFARRISSHGNERVEARIECLDPREVRIDHGNRRERPRAYAHAQVGDRSERVDGCHNR
jgi:hypothetical protein